MVQVSGSTALMFAEQVDTVRLLLKRGADVTLKNQVTQNFH
jgi:hypothetical protein